MYNSIDVCQLLVQFVMAVNYRYISLQNGSQFGEGQFEQRMSSTYGSQGRVAGSLLLFWQRLPHPTLPFWILHLVRYLAGICKLNYQTGWKRQWHFFLPAIYLIAGTCTSLHQRFIWLLELVITTLERRIDVSNCTARCHWCQKRCVVFGILRVLTEHVCISDSVGSETFLEKRDGLKLECFGEILEQLVWLWTHFNLG